MKTQQQCCEITQELSNFTSDCSSSFYLQHFNHTRVIFMQLPTNIKCDGKCYN